MRRRDLLKGCAAATLAAARPPRAAQAQSAPGSVLRYVPAANLTLLDPIWSTAYVSICHGYAVFDAPYAADAGQNPRPQMLQGHEVSVDGRAWSLRLREGLTFHDGEPVRASDCAASFARWAARQSTGQVVGAFVESWSTADDRTIKVTLKQPLPTLAYLMANSVFPPFVMPERLARTAPDKQVTEMIGSGPFRFNAAEYVSGNRVVYEKFAGYAPRPEPAEWTSGGKIAKVGRVEWRIIPDQATAAAALQQGEIDWLEAPPADLQPLLRKHRDITLDVIDPTGWTGFLRFNQLQKPFDNVKIRQAVLMAVRQEDYLRLAAGDDPTSYTVCKSVFPCGTPFGREIGADAMRGDLEAAKRLLKEGGYAGEKVVILQPADLAPYGDFATITADLLRQIGMTVDLVASDWGTVTQRRAKKEPVEQGGWSIFVSGVNGPAIMNPAVNFLIRGQGQRGYFGWYDNPEIEKLASEWLQSEQQTERARLADLIQGIAFRTVPYVPLGQYVVRTAYRRNVQGVLHGPAVLPWNVAKV
ncbi:MAG TPA: ABC transporter substrate-binding protein [Xanthobacteraceae bacterium]|nr:ABC transporter substrate-binding protein [Xanthobacteraceae bacterium]